MSNDTEQQLMSSSDFSKVYILGTFFRKFKREAAWQQFIDINDIGLPLAFLMSIGAAKPTGDGQAYVDQTWIDFCEYVGVSVDNDYPTLWELLDNAENVK